MTKPDVPHVPERHVLDFIRWVSASMVALGHVLGIVIHRPSPSTSLSSLDGVLSYISDFRGVSVVIFFVLSGYLVGGSLLRRQDVDWMAYFTARFCRIYVVLIPALLLTAGTDALFINTQHGASVYTGVWSSGVLGDKPIIDRYGLANIFGSMLSLEPILGRPLGSNGALWSLGYEWIFYLVFPVIVIGGRKLSGKFGPYGAALVVLVACTALHARWTAVFFGIWLLGAWAEQLSRKSLLPAFVSAGLGFAALITFLCAPLLSAQVSTCLVGVTFAAFLAQRHTFEARLKTPWDHKLSSFSYSLYLTHMVIITAIAELLVRARVLDRNGRTADGLAACEVLAMLSVSVVVAIGFYLAFERQTGGVRRTIYAALSARLVAARLTA